MADFVLSYTESHAWGNFHLEIHAPDDSSLNLLSQTACILQMLESLWHGSFVAWQANPSSPEISGSE